MDLTGSQYNTVNPSMNEKRYSLKRKVGKARNLLATQSVLKSGQSIPKPLYTVKLFIIFFKILNKKIFSKTKKELLRQKFIPSSGSFLMTAPPGLTFGFPPYPSPCVFNQRERAEALLLNTSNN